ncbi:MAG: hypothetical protein MMC33_003515 [Icmadophila ericetorum]|nr:hypothetical protein [Icmadophila ericetorum]
MDEQVVQRTHPPHDGAGLGSWHPAWRPETYPSDVIAGQHSQSGSVLEDSEIVPHHSAQSKYGENLPQTAHDGSALQEEVSPSTGKSTKQPVLSLNTGLLDQADPDNQPTIFAQPEVVSNQQEGGSVERDRVAHETTNQEHVPPRISRKGSLIAVGEPSDFVWDSEVQSNSIDPAWGLNPENLGGGDIDDIFGPSSFPEVPPLHSARDLSTFHALPLSQVEDIMAEIEGNGQHASADTEHYLTHSPEMLHEHKDLDHGGWEEGNTEDNPFANVNGIESHGLAESTDKQAKLEEFVPLVQEKAQEICQGTSEILRDPQDFLFDQTAPDTSKDDFFSEVDTGSQNVMSSIERPADLEVRSSMRNDLKSSQADSLFDGESHLIAGDGGDDFDALLGSSAVPQSNFGDTGAQKSEVGKPSGLDTKEQDLVALWEAALSDDELLEDEPSVDSSGFFDEDGDGFLPDNNETVSDHFSQALLASDDQKQNFPNAIAVDARSNMIQGRRVSGGFAHPQGAANQAYSPSQYSAFSQPSYLPEANAIPNSFQPAPGYTGAGQQSPYTRLGAPERPGMGEKAQSFADKSKGGYTSPYDLPMELSRPKRRTNMPQLQNGNQAPPNLPTPPPRSSSMQPSIPPPEPTAYRLPPTTSPRTSISSLGPSHIMPPANAATSAVSKKTSSASFFEELPITAKPRPASSAGRSISQLPQPQHSGPPTSPAMGGQFNQPQRPIAPVPPPSAPPGYQQLRAPERVLPYTNMPEQSTAIQPIPATNQRYSPAPQGQPNSLPNRNRYATPSGPVRPPSVSQLPFQPRTSSPLNPQARSASSQQYRPGDDPTYTTLSKRPSLQSGFGSDLQRANIDSIMGTNIPSSTSAPPQLAGSIAPPRSMQYHHPLEQSQKMSPGVPPVSIPEERAFEPPRRSQTQSPGSIISPSANQTNGMLQYQRRTSVNDPPPTNLNNPYTLNRGATFGSVPNTFSPNVDYIVPNDGREHDPLERWKGCPVFNFGFGGTIVTSFPKQVPRFASGQTMIKCSPGEVKVVNKALPIDQRAASFPGPLKSKSKKKEVLDWLGKSIEQLNQEYVQVSPHQVLEEIRKRHEEKVLLWQVIRVLVEFDGVIEGNIAAEKAVRSILSPEMSVGAVSGQISYEATLPTRSTIRRNTLKSLPTAEDSEALEAIRNLLLQGEREKAVWSAVDQRLWGHAMLISSTLPREVWKNVIHEFVRQEVRMYGENTESIAALYDVFAGNWEEIIDELVPPSARAGLQMVSKASGPGPAKNALDGLDRWRETLSLILSNRSPDDGKALIALGQLLAGYGRIEAAHICYIFTKSPAFFGGPDDTQASAVLLGADHRRQPFDYSRDLDSVLLTETYEFILTCLGPSAISIAMPHLQAYKLHHAIVLAENGFRNEAQQYCDAIQTTLKATTRLSPYYHSLLFDTLDDLNSRLRQVPKESSSSWMPKPNMDNVSNTIFNRFTKFVAGDDSDAASTGSGKDASEAGPFAKISGDSPIISRGPSPSDLYGSYTTGGAYPPGVPPAPAPTNSRYAPGGLYTPQLSQEQSPPVALDSPIIGRLEPMKHSALQKQKSYSSMPRFSPGPNATGFSAQPRPSTANYPPNPRSYQPTPPPQADFIPTNDSQLQPNLTDKYGAYSPQPMLSPSYSPNTQPADASSCAGSQPSPSLSPEIRSHRPGPRSYEPSPSPNLERPLLNHDSSYMPSPSYEPSAHAAEKPPSPPVEPPTPTEAVPTYGGYEPPSSSYDPPSDSYEPSSSSYEPPTSSYEPPSSSYDPPSYEPNGEDSPIEIRPKKKSYMDDDDDDDLAAQAATLKKNQSKTGAPKEREVDDAVRRAAAEDAKRDTEKAKAKSSGWGLGLGGWFGGSKPKDLGDSSSGSGTANKPIKARLGEESSFHYDPGLKRWVNKKDPGASTEKASGTPPPPRSAPPSRGPSGAGGPPPPLPSTGPPGKRPTLQLSNPSSNTPSRTASPQIGNGITSAVPTPPPQSLSPASTLQGPPAALRSVSGPPSGPPSAPPSRPGTAVGGLDDLLGGDLAPRKGGTVKGKKKGRGYVDVLGK